MATVVKIGYSLSKQEKKAMQHVLEKYTGAPTHHYEVHASLGVPGWVALFPDEALYLAGIIQPYYSFLADQLREHPYFKEKKQDDLRTL